tara:strand:+ start:3532 stop:4269 length:738 start_codon:yes stop_codon:yes gene_type:complete
MEKICFLFIKYRYLQYPETSLVSIYLDKVVLVVTAQYELTEELHLPFVLSLGLQFIDVGRTQVFDTLCQLFFIEQYLVDTDEQFICPVRIELAAETIVGQIGHIVVEQGLHPFQEGAFARGTFFGDQTQNRQYLYRFGVEQLQVVQPQFIMFAENMFHKIQRGRTFSFFWDCRQRGIGVIEPFIFLFEINMAGYAGKPIVLWNLAQVILTMVLADGLDVPMHQYFIEMPCDGRCLYQFIVRGSYP